MSTFNLDRFDTDLGRTVTVDFVDASSSLDDPKTVPVRLRGRRRHRGAERLPHGR